MEVFIQIISLFGGLALFLYGMQTMGDGLRKSSGSALKTVLARVTNRRLMAFILGMLVTAMIQSSKATIVLTVGLVGAGFLTFQQSIGIVLGANVGTAITAQIIRLMDMDAGSGSILSLLNSKNLSSIALVAGMILFMGFKSKNKGAVATILTGLGILFVGLANMSSAVSSMGDALSKLLTAFENNYIFGFFSGIIATTIIQSSSAVVGIIQSIASSVGVRFCGIFAVIVGVNIGDCLSTYLVCRIGAKPEQIRTCLIHIIYNVFAAILVFLAVFIFHSLGIISEDIWNASLNSGGVANVHGLFRLVPAILLLPFSGIFANIAVKMAPDVPVDDEEADIEKNLRELDPRLVGNPTIALLESDHLIKHMAEVAKKNYTASVAQVFSYNEEVFNKIRRREGLLDRMTDASNQYLLAISPNITLDSDYRNQSFQLKVSTCFERIGDRADNINDCMTGIWEGKKQFSDAALKDIRVLADAVQEILDISVKAYMESDIELAKQIEPLEEVVDELVEVLGNRHVDRMATGSCNAESGIQYGNILQHLGRVSDHCSDIGLYILALADPQITGNEHQYIHNLHHSNNPEYLSTFKKWHEKYLDAVSSVQ